MCVFHQDVRSVSASLCCVSGQRSSRDFRLLKEINGSTQSTYIIDSSFYPIVFPFVTLPQAISLHRQKKQPLKCLSTKSLHIQFKVSRYRYHNGLYCLLGLNLMLLFPPLLRLPPFHGKLSKIQRLFFFLSKIPEDTVFDVIVCCRKESSVCCSPNNWWRILSRGR